VPLMFLLSLAVQIMFAMHVIKTGRDRFWIWIILMFPGMGCLIYFIVEVLPGAARGPAAQKAHRTMKKALDPEKEYREALYALETAPTVNNRLRVAQILTGRGDYDGVINVLEPALTGPFASDPVLHEGLAHARYYKGDYRDALAHMQKIYDNPDMPPKDYIRLLRARVLQKAGDREAARAELTDLVKSYSGEEARITLAQLHEEMGDRDAAQAIYRDIIARSAHAPAYYQKREAAWIAIARKNLR
jgi:hypothetical protein